MRGGRRDCEVRFEHNRIEGVLFDGSKSDWQQVDDETPSLTPTRPKMRDSRQTVDLFVGKLVPAKLGSVELNSRC